MSKKPMIFISYAHEDEKWKDRLEKHLTVLKHQGVFDTWTDRQIDTGADWLEKIQSALDSAAVGVLLVSVHSLTSDFILRNEVTTLLKRRHEGDFHIFPIIVSPCPWKLVNWFSPMQVRPKDGKPLSKMSKPDADEALSDMAIEIAKILRRVNIDSEDEQVKAEYSLGEFDLHLRELGAHMGKAPEIEVKEKLPGGNEAYYDPRLNSMVVSKASITDVDIVRREYCYRAFSAPPFLHPAFAPERNKTGRGFSFQVRAIVSGLGYYLPCSFKGDPSFGLFGAPVLDGQKLYYNSYESPDNPENLRGFARGERWAHAFWGMRERLGAEVLDCSIIGALGELREADYTEKFEHAFVENILRLLRSLHGIDANMAMTEALDKWGL